METKIYGLCSKIFDDAVTPEERKACMNLLTREIKKGHNFSSNRDVRRKRFEIFKEFKNDYFKCV